ncbi:MAG: fasciclin domain-containing protein [Phycisphaerales bacterium JB043]
MKLHRLALVAPLFLSANALAGGHSSKGYAKKADIVDTAVKAGSFNTLAAALEAADLIDTLKGDGPFTVFAPTDEAFARLPEGTIETLLKPENKQLLTSILTYHVVAGDVRASQVVTLDGATTVNGQRVDISVNGSSVMVDKASVSATDIVTSNGVIHVIDSVILPESRDIIDVAVDAGSFTTLAAALEATGLISALQSDGPFTVFAPTDEAFAKLPEGTVENLLKPENLDQLRSILLYHVVEGRVYSDQAATLRSAGTLEGSEFRIRANRGTIKINDSKVIGADVDASNGVIHVIDTVLLPE